MYQELKGLRNSPARQNYHLEATDLIATEYEVENFMTIHEQPTSFQDMAMLDSASTRTILNKAQFFHFQSEKSWSNCKILTMTASRTLRFREGRTTIVLPGGFSLNCEKAMYAPDAPRCLISYRDLRTRNIHACTTLQGSEEVIELRQGPRVMATANAGPDGLYKVARKPLASSPSTAAEEVCMDAWGVGPMTERNLAHGTPQGVQVVKPDIWHSRLIHPGTTMFRRMIPLVQGHNLTASDAGKTKECRACIQGKLIKRPFLWTLPNELPPPIHRIHGDLCGPINPPSGAFRYYFVLADASGSHLEVSLLPTRNMVFPRALAILLMYKSHFPNSPIKHLRLDNAKEFR